MVNLPSSDLGSSPPAVVTRADALETAGRRFDAIDLLTTANRAQPDSAIEMRLARLRHAAFDDLDRTQGFRAWHPGVTSAPRDTSTIPELPHAGLTADAVRANVLAHGCVRVPSVLAPSAVDELVEGIDHAFAVWSCLRRPFARPTGSPWFDPLPVDEASRPKLGRTWVTNGSGILTVDSPRMLFTLLDAFESIGLREVVGEYLGERPVLSAAKCTLRRVPVDTDAGWHQDGAFLGRDIRAINVWLALSDCGVDAPGLDIVPRRFDEIVPTGSHGSYFDWAVGPDLVEEIAGPTPVVRPIFAAGDVLLFDDKLLHRTATDPAMTRPRYAIETWFFAASHYPEGHVPVVW